MTNDPKPKVKLAQGLPDPPEITAEVRERILREGKEWRAEVAEKGAAIEAVTAEDLRVRAR